MTTTSCSPWSTSTPRTRRRAWSRFLPTWACRRSSACATCSTARGTTGAWAATTSASSPAIARHTSWKSCNDPRHRTPAARGLLAEPLVRARPALVQARGLLRDPPSRLLRRQRRRLRRLPRPHREARLPCVARRRLHLAAADVRLPAARRRLRHRGFLRDPPRLRDRRGLRALHHRRPPARHSRDRRPRHEPHVLGSRLVPG